MRAIGLPREGGPVAATPEPVRLALDEKLTAGLMRQARQHGLTLNSVLQGGWAILLGRLSAGRLGCRLSGISLFAAGGSLGLGPLTSLVFFLVGKYPCAA